MLACTAEGSAAARSAHTPAQRGEDGTASAVETTEDIKDRRKKIATRTAGLILGVAALIICIAVPTVSDSVDAWGLVPLLVHAVFVVLGFNILLSTDLAAGFAIIMAS